MTFSDDSDEYLNDSDEEYRPPYNVNKSLSLKNHKKTPQEDLKTFLETHAPTRCSQRKLTGGEKVILNFVLSVHFEQFGTMSLPPSR